MTQLNTGIMKAVNLAEFKNCRTIAEVEAVKQRQLAIMEEEHQKRISEMKKEFAEKDAAISEITTEVEEAVKSKDTKSILEAMKKMTEKMASVYGV